ncbi:MAG: hypothetical protein HND42_05380 [Armatimonadetes bacterium]|nr:hypothetical protein [Armatimonadota bacterium]NOG92658.1 hypothetical protein [Armatimonadota bacterium]
MRKSAALCTLPLLAAAAMANDGSWIASGGAGAFAPNDQIQLVSEDLRIVLGDDVTRVKVTFTFKNSGGGTRVTMAFPEQGSGDVAGPSIEKFASWVDGTKVKVTYKALTPQDQGDAYKGVWLKEVAFQKGQTRKVIVEYTVRNYGSVVGDKGMTYILQTGATWKDDIDDLKITVDWTGVREYSKPEIQTVRIKDEFGFETAPTTLPWRAPSARIRTLTLKDFEPDFDLDLHMIGGFWNFSLNGRPISFACMFRNFSIYKPFREGSDVLFPVDSLPTFFGRPEGEYDWIGYALPECDMFGNNLEFEQPDKVKTGDGQVLTLRRPLRSARYPIGIPVPADYVFLKDLILALGGTYNYISAEERVAITLPTTSR